MIVMLGCSSGRNQDDGLSQARADLAAKITNSDTSVHAIGANNSTFRFSTATCNESFKEQIGLSKDTFVKAGIKSVQCHGRDGNKLTIEIKP